MPVRKMKIDTSNKHFRRLVRKVERLRLAIILASMTIIFGIAIFGGAGILEAMAVAIGIGWAPLWPLAMALPDYDGIAKRRNESRRYAYR